MPAIARAQANGPIRPNNETARERKGERSGARGSSTTGVAARFMVRLLPSAVGFGGTG
jgi:hypothetical protein